MRRFLFPLGFLTILTPLALAACGAPSAAQRPAAANPTPSCAPVAARSPRPAGSPPAGFVPGRGNPGGFGRPLATGTVSSYSGGLMTVTDRRTGQLDRVTVDASTQVTSGLGASASTTAKIAKGENVSVFGTQNSDGSITATRVSVLPSSFNPACGRPRGATPPSSQPG